MAEAVSTGKDSKRWSWKMALAPGISSTLHAPRRGKPCSPRSETCPWSPWMTSCVAVSCGKTSTWDASSCGVEESSKKAVLIPGKVRLVLYGWVNQCKETCFILFREDPSPQCDLLLSDTWGLWTSPHLLTCFCLLGTSEGHSWHDLSISPRTFSSSKQRLTSIHASD